MPDAAPRHGALALVVAAFVFIGVMTLRPAVATTVLPPTCIICGEYGLTDFVLNVALFVPLGVGLQLWRGRWRLAVGIGFATTVMVESLQVRLVTGRDASLGDILANTLGAALGAWLIVAATRWTGPSSPAARRAAGGLSIVTTAVVTASAWLLSPAPSRQRQFIIWTSLAPNSQRFGGTLLSAQVNGVPVQRGDVMHGVPPAPALTLRIAVRGPVRPTTRPAHILSLANPLTESFHLGQDGRAVTFRSRVRGSGLRLRPPSVRLIDALDPAPPSEMLAIEAISEEKSITIRRTGTTVNDAVVVRRSVGLAWSLLQPWSVAIDDRSWPVNAIWLGLLVLPCAFFVRRGYRSARMEPALARASWTPLFLVSLVLAVVPSRMGLAALEWREWMGAALGVALGFLLERLTRKLTHRALNH